MEINSSNRKLPCLRCRRSGDWTNQRVNRIDNRGQMDDRATGRAIVTGAGRVPHTCKQGTSRSDFDHLPGAITGSEHQPPALVDKQRPALTMAGVPSARNTLHALHRCGWHDEGVDRDRSADIEQPLAILNYNMRTAMDGLQTPFILAVD
jgi:hypothetical protein